MRRPSRCRIIAWLRKFGFDYNSIEWRKQKRSARVGLAALLKLGSRLGGVDRHWSGGGMH